MTDMTWGMRDELWFRWEAAMTQWEAAQTALMRADRAARRPDAGPAAVAEALTAREYSRSLADAVHAIEDEARVMGVDLQTLPHDAPWTEAERDWFRGRLGMDPTDTDGGQDA